MANRNVGADDHEGAVLQRCARDGSSGAAAKRQIRLCIKPPTDGRVQACKDGKGFLIRRSARLAKPGGICGERCAVRAPEVAFLKEARGPDS